MQQMVRETQLRTLDKRYKYYVKPKHVRQKRLEQREYLAGRAEFSRKLDIAIEMMQRETEDVKFGAAVVPRDCDYSASDVDQDVAN